MTGRARDGGDLAARFAGMWAALEPVGRRPDGGYDRFSWTGTDTALRSWFREAAARRDMTTEEDPNGNLWAWWGTPHAGGAVATGSHLDSVPAGGAFDGPLGVVSAFLAVDELRVRGETPVRPVAVAAFCEEEGARFGVACLGSRLSTGALGPERARALRDAAGTTLAEAMHAAGADPAGLGADDGRLSSIGCYVELHVEQGRGLATLGAPVGVATRIWPHGRWRISLEGAANHAGTSRLGDRRDPVVPLAAAVTGARAAAALHGGLATIGRIEVRPNATNAVAAGVDAWLDARAPDEPALDAVVGEVRGVVERAAAAHGVAAVVEEESRTPDVAFDEALRARVSKALDGAPELATGAGHDAGVLAARFPTAMLFVRNPTGVSHSPLEHADPADCLEGVRALATVLGELAC